MNIFAVTVTYADRFELLKQTVEAAFDEGILKVIIVDNNSVTSSKTKLKEYEKEFADKIQVIYLDDNYGSAGGFKRGLQEAYLSPECDFILALDDDNKIENGGITKIKSLLSYFDNIQANKIMFSFYREAWKWQKDAVQKGIIKGYQNNNFIGFNLLTFIKQKFGFGIITSNMANFFPLQPTTVAAMGGLFFHKSVIENNGLPNEDFVVYADDYDYTYKFTKNGGNIFICSEIKIEDLDLTYEENLENVSYTFRANASEFKIFYGTRNHVHFSKLFCTNKIYFYTNLVFVVTREFTYITKVPFATFTRRFSLYIRAIKDGLNGTLGRTF